MTKQRISFGWWIFGAACIAVLFVLLTSLGCRHLDGSGIPNSLPAVGSNIEKSLAHVESADRLVKAAVPHSDPTGKELLGVSVEEHKEALKTGNQAKVELSEANVERGKMATVIVDQGKEIVKVTSGWGYKLQMRLTSLWHKLLWIVGTVMFLHVAFGITGLMVAGPTGAIFARLGAIVNPFAWFQTIRDNIHFNRVIAAAKGE